MGIVGVVFISYQCAGELSTYLIVPDNCAQPITFYGLISLPIIHDQLTSNHRDTYLIQREEYTAAHFDTMISSKCEFSLTYSMIQLKLTFESFESNRYFIGLAQAQCYGLGQLPDSITMSQISHSQNQTFSGNS